jgi:tetratricopeptide (TPR) repeat protein
MSKKLDLLQTEREAVKQGFAYYNQKKYKEAEAQLQQAAEGQERILGKDHAVTLCSKHWLGRALYDQGKYSEAEMHLQQATAGQEVIFGRHHEDTLTSKHWLGLAIYNQKRYSEAEMQLQEAADGRKCIYGSDHIDTLYSKHMLGLVLYEQKRYNEAKVHLQQAAGGQEKILGGGDEITLYTKHWLGRVLLDQREFREAQVHLQEVAERRKKVLGKDHADTLATLDLLHKVKLELNAPSSLPSNDVTWQAPTDRLESFFSEERDRRAPYTDSEIHKVSSLLNLSSPQWSKVPRTYIILRTIGHLDLLHDIVDLGFSDFWFPVTEQNLPGCLSPSARTSFVDAQQIVMTKSIDLEKGQNGQHCYFEQGDPLPFEPKEVLGSGGFGQVDKVLSRISFKEYARKRVLRSAAFRGRQKEDMKQFIAEIQLSKRLKHRHVVEFVGSYTDTRYIGLIMSPVAEMDLRAYLERCTAHNYPELRTFFGCLATALEFLHEQKVRHKDIKPSNILVNCGNVLFADFGLSLDFIDASGSTTTGMTAKTPRYCAPEVAEYGPRNTSSDMWSLGVVFIEMAVVLKGMTTIDMDEFFRKHGSQQTFIRTNMATLPQFVTMIKGIGQPSDNIVFSWIQQMLFAEQQLRLTASSLVTSILESESVGFCGICCVSPEERFSDWTDE